MKAQKTKLLALLLSTVLLTGCLSDDDDAKAEAGASVSVKERRSIVISDATASGEGAVTVAWTQISGPQLSLSGADTLTPQITAPSLDADATAVLRLTVTDSKGQIAEDDLTVNVTNNTLPVLTAGLDAIAEKTEVELTAPLSDDGQIVAVSWLQTAGPDVTLNGADSDTISFTSPAVTEVTSLTFMLSATDDDDETAALEISVEVEPNLMAFTLEGQVSGADFSGGSAMLTGASGELTTQVGENGVFSFDLQLDDDLLDSVISVQISAEDNDRLTYSAIYAGFSEPVVATTLSAFDTAMTAVESSVSSSSNTVAVNAVSTALYSLLLIANSGEVPTNIEDLMFVEKSVDADELAEAAAVVKILTENPEIALPEGVTDITALLADIAAYNSIVEQIEATQPGIIETTIVAIIDDPTLTPPVTADTLQSLYFNTYATAPGFLARTGSRWQFNDDGTGANTRETGNFAFEWQIQDGKVQVAYTNPAVYFIGSSPAEVGLAGLTQQQVDWLLADGITQVQPITVVDSLKLTRITEGQVLDTFRQTGLQRQTIGPITTSQGLVESSSEAIEYSGNILMRKKNSSGMAFTAEQMIGTWAVNTYYSQNLPLLGGDIADFYLDPLIFHADGSGVGAVTQRTFSWQVNNGQVSLSMSDDSNVVLEIIDQSGTDFQVFTTVYDTTDHLLAAQAEYAFRVQEGIAINLLINGEEKYWQTMINSEAKDSWDNGRLLFCPGDPTCENTTGVFSPFFGWDFNQDNTGNRILAPYPLTDFPPALDPKASSPPFTWSPSEGGQISMVYSSGNQLRYWLPLKVEQGVLGRRLYVREEAFSFGNLQIAGRIGMYEEIDYEYWNITAPQHATGLNVFKQQRHVVKRSKLMPLTK